MYLLQQCHFFMCQKSSRLAGSGTTASSPTAACLCTRSGAGADGARLASPARCRVPHWPSLAAAAVGSKTWTRTCTEVYVFLSGPGTVSGKCCQLGLQAPWGSGDGISSSWDLPSCALLRFQHLLPEHVPCCQRYPRCSSRFSQSRSWVYSLFFCLMV